MRFSLRYRNLVRAIALALLAAVVPPFATAVYDVLFPQTHFFNCFGTTVPGQD
jgi:hypothetical protein